MIVDSPDSSQMAHSDNAAYGKPEWATGEQSLLWEHLHLPRYRDTTLSRYTDTETSFIFKAILHILYVIANEFSIKKMFLLCQPLFLVTDLDDYISTLQNIQA